MNNSRFDIKNLITSSPQPYHLKSYWNITWPVKQWTLTVPGRTKKHIQFLPSIFGIPKPFIYRIITGRCNFFYLFSNWAAVSSVLLSFTLYIFLRQIQGDWTEIQGRHKIKTEISLRHCSNYVATRVFHCVQIETQELVFVN